MARFRGTIMVGGALVGFLAGGAASEAGWTATNLHPGVTTKSSAYSTFSAREAGFAEVNGNEHAGIWNGTALSWVDLHPTGMASTSRALGEFDNVQVGRVQVTGSVFHAALWKGTSDSFVDLNPVGATESVANGISGSTQAGYATIGSVRRACTWKGTAASFVDLHPGGSESTVTAISAGYEVGYAFMATKRAALWHGTPESFVDLTPANSIDSTALGVSGFEQSGVAYLNGAYHAVMWRSSAFNWVDLHPAGAASSSALSIYHGLQAGFAFYGGKPHAGMWKSSAASWFDLHALLPAGFTQSIARSIMKENHITYISGEGSNGLTGRVEAILWIYQNTCPADLNLDAVVDDADFVPFVQGYDILDCQDPAMPGGCPADLNGDRYVEDADFSIFVQAYNALLCP